MIPLPEGFRVVLDRSVRTYRNGAVLVGGSPLRVLRLSATGQAALKALRSGESASPQARVLGRRLVDAWMARAVPVRDLPRAEITVVVPVHDRAAQLDRCLTALDGESAVVVVDDGSSRESAAAIAAVCARHRARLLIREHSGGPAAARNDALMAIGTEYVAFLDSDCVPTTGWITQLARHLADPTVAAVAPRVRSLSSQDSRSVRARYSTSRSALDMGARGGEVTLGMPVAYVPAAALLGRRSALAGGFDESLRYGEDVDLVWRLLESGWRVRYAPEVLVHHDEPQTWTGLLRRRFLYGTSAGPLARRHPGRLRAVVLPLRAVTGALLLLSRRPRTAALALGIYAWRTGSALHTAGAPPMIGAWYAGRSAGLAVVALGRATTMFAPTLLALGLCWRRTRLLAFTLLVSPPLAEAATSRPRLDPIRFAAAAVADDVAYGLGVWLGCVKARTFEPVTPAIRWRARRADSNNRLIQ